MMDKYKAAPPSPSNLVTDTNTIFAKREKYFRKYKIYKKKIHFVIIKIYQYDGLMDKHKAAHPLHQTLLYLAALQKCYFCKKQIHCDFLRKYKRRNSPKKQRIPL